MWCVKKPEVASRSFRVTHVTTEAGLETALSVCASGHSIDQVLLSRLLMRDASQDDGVSTWVAWDGDEAVSVVWLTHGERIGVWEMMTPPEHRRRGAGRTVLSAALADSWSPSTQGAFLWASPAGRPPYESLGFRALDEPLVWVSEGWADANAAVGQPV